MITASILLVIFLGFILTDHFKRLRKFKWLNQFGGPSPTLPIVGNALQFIGHRSRMAGVFHSNFQNFGSTHKLWLMKRPSLITSDCDLVKLILNSSKHLQKHFAYSYSAKIVMGNGLVTSDVDQWKLDRKYFNRFFSLEYFASSFKLSSDIWPKLEKTIDSNANEPLSCQKHFSKYFLTIVLHSFFSDPSLITEKCLCDIEELFIIGLDILNIRIMKPWRRISLYWKLSGYDQKLKNFHKHIRSIFNGFSQINDEHQKEDLGSVVKYDDRNNDLTEEDNSARPSKTFKHFLMDTTKPVEWKYDHTITFIGGGVDTVTIAATMTLFFLALNPEYQKKAQDEIDSLFLGDNNESLNFRDVSKMKYLRMCIKEAMRLHPPIPILGRTTTEDILMRDGRKIPKGTSVIIPLQELSLNPDYFPNPHRFDPERFSEENSPSIIPYTYIPFSGGPRNCIGQKYAEHMLSPMLAHLLRNYTVSTLQKSKDITILYEVAGTPYPDVQLIFSRRSEVIFKH